MSFHRPQDYILLLLTMTTFLALGLRRSRDSFQIALLIGCAMLSFYAQRNIWLVTLASITVIGEAIPARLQAPPWRWEPRAVLIATAIIFFVAAQRIPQQETLLATIRQNYPVRAADYIRDHHLPPPLFNTIEWGGFLTWYLPEYPVAIDGRRYLYGEDFQSQYFKAMNAEMAYPAFPALAESGTLLLPRSSLMGKALSTLRRSKSLTATRLP